MSESEVMVGEEKKREEYPYTPIPILLSNKTNLYIPETFKPTITKLKTILQRENKSLSDWFREQVEPYVRLHELGNNQTLIKTFTDPNESGPMKVVCSRIRGAMSDGHVLCDRKESGPIWIQGFRCYGCESNKLRSQK